MHTHRRRATVRACTREYRKGRGTVCGIMPEFRQTNRGDFDASHQQNGTGDDRRKKGYGGPLRLEIPSFV